MQASASMGNEECNAELLDTQCKVCLKNFTTKEQHRAHFQICKRQMRCQLCTQSFTIAKNFHAHIGICRGNGVYMCMYCMRIFTDATKCLKHKSLCSCRYSCKRCPEKFPTTKLLLKHCKDEHPKEQCHICKSFYERKDDLEKHIAKAHKS